MMIASTVYSMFLYIFLILLHLFLIIFCATTSCIYTSEELSTSSNIHVRLNSEWSNTSLLYEAFEYLYDRDVKMNTVYEYTRNGMEIGREPPEAFVEFVDYMANTLPLNYSSAMENDWALIQSWLSMKNSFKDEALKGLFIAFLMTRKLYPKIYYQLKHCYNSIPKENIGSACHFLSVNNGEIYITLAEKINDVDWGTAIPVPISSHPLDTQHGYIYYYHSNERHPESLLILDLFGDPSKPEFYHYHSIIKTLLPKLRGVSIRYTFYLYIKDFEHRQLEDEMINEERPSLQKDRFHLPGGFEIDFRYKNTEYNVINIPNLVQSERVNDTTTTGETPFLYDKKEGSWLYTLQQLENKVYNTILINQPLNTTKLTAYETSISILGLSNENPNIGAQIILNIYENLPLFIPLLQTYYNSTLNNTEAMRKIQNYCDKVSELYGDLLETHGNSESDVLVWMNGYKVNVASASVFKMLEWLEVYYSYMGLVSQLLASEDSFSAFSARDWLAPIDSHYREFLFDVNGEGLVSLNNVEHDMMYQSWSAHPNIFMECKCISGTCWQLKTMLEVIPTLRKTIGKAVIMIDPIYPGQLRWLLGLADFIMTRMPINVNILFALPEKTSTSTDDKNFDFDSARELIAKIFFYLKMTKGMTVGLMFLEKLFSISEAPKINLETVELLLTKLGFSSAMVERWKSTDIKVNESKGENIQLQKMKDLYTRFNSFSMPCILLNGQAVQSSSSGVAGPLIETFYRQCKYFHRSLTSKKLAWKDNWYEFYLNSHSSLQSRDALIFGEWHSLPAVSVINNERYGLWEWKILKAKGKQKKNASLWVSLNIRSLPQHLRYLETIIVEMTSWKEHPNLYILLFDDSSSDDLLNFEWKELFKLYKHRTTTLEKFIEIIESILMQMDDACMLASTRSSQKSVDDESIHKIKSICSKQTNILQLLKKEVPFSIESKEWTDQWVIYNGRLVKLNEANVLKPRELFLFIHHTDRSMLPTKDEKISIITSVTRMALSCLKLKMNKTVLSERLKSFVSSSTFHYWESFEHLFAYQNIRLMNDASSTDPLIEWRVLTCPLAKHLGKVLRTLNMVHEISGKSNMIRIWLFAMDHGSEEPISMNHISRYILPSMSLNYESNVAQPISNTALLNGLPSNTLFTVALVSPHSWLAFSTNSSQFDLDNFILHTPDCSQKTFRLVYGLSHLLIEGSAMNLYTGTAPRGLQLVLFDETGNPVDESIVMANYGYFQLKAPYPGIYSLALREGRSMEMFVFVSPDATDTDEMGFTPTVKVDTWEGLAGMKLFVRPKKGYENIPLLQGDVLHPSSTSMLFHMSQYLPFHHSSAKASNTNHAEVNVFSIASGHLYERFLRIMMRSVALHTKHSVKFWFIGNFLSPDFLRSLPYYSAALGCTYEIITYSWPNWLLAQKEKQREIWAYKILFLDVLFPLDLDRIIFVDADMTVRADLFELVTLQLDSRSPYAFTPFCDCRLETEGFRFWKSGYWARALAGKSYHISALFVVDLKRFRELAAGDILRAQYQVLAVDPNSLANLDQDLPNNLQDILPITSLDLSWCWCETWCSDERLFKAKAIDLCNNPLTKEPKLKRARRILPEWDSYDSWIEQCLSTVDSWRLERTNNTTHLDWKHWWEIKQKQFIFDSSRKEHLDL